MIGGVLHEDDFLADPGDFRVRVLNVASPFLDHPSDRYGENGRVWRLRAMSFNSLFPLLAASSRLFIQHIC